LKSGEFLDIFSYLIDNTNVLTALGLGAVLGLLIMGLWSQRTQRELEQSLLIAKEKLVILDERSQLCEAQQEELTRAHILTAQLQARLEEQQKHGSEKLKLLQDAEAQLKLQFESLANQIFDTKSKQFKEQNNQSLNEIVSPLKDQLGDFKKRIEHVYEHETRDRVTLREEISQLRQDTQKMNQEALNLTRALKGDNKTQGNWGEMILEKVLEESGLRKGVEYDPQGSFRDDDNSLFKPDVIIRLPGDKDVVVDSKVSLIAYERYCSTEDDAERVKALKEHSLAVRQHIKGLSEKDYSSLKGLRSLDFVLLFIPIESAFIAAFQADEKVFADAFEHKIVVVTPTTLLATLRTIENIWRYERRNENARIIAEKAGALYDKIRGFVEDLDKLGTQLSTVNKTYDGVMNKLTLGQGNLIRQASSFVELGVQVKKTIPKKISEQATLEDEES